MQFPRSDYRFIRDIGGRTYVRNMNCLHLDDIHMYTSMHNRRCISTAVAAAAAVTVTVCLCHWNFACATNIIVHILFRISYYWKKLLHRLQISHITISIPFFLSFLCFSTSETRSRSNSLRTHCVVRAFICSHFACDIMCDGEFHCTADWKRTKMLQWLSQQHPVVCMPVHAYCKDIIVIVCRRARLNELIKSRITQFYV